MKVNRNYLNLDSDGREILEDGLQLFNLIVNEGDINSYLTGSIPPHYHTELELFLLEEGSVEIGINDISVTLQAGDGCFINSGVLHSYRGTVATPCTYRSFVFSPSIVGGMAGSVFDSVYVQPLIQSGPTFMTFSSDDRAFRTEFEKCLAAAEDEKEGYEFEIRNALSALILQVRSKSRMDSRDRSMLIQDERFKKLIAWVEKNLSADFSIAEMAADAGISARECQRLFVRYLHYSPVAYIQRRRVFTAAGMLVNTSMTISEIAVKCGFSSSSYFSKQFRAQTGSSPLEYRQKARSQMQD